MCSGLACKNLKDKGGVGRGTRRLHKCKCTAHRLLLSVPTSADGPHPRTTKHRETDWEGLRRMPAQPPAKTKLFSHPATSQGLSSAPPAAQRLRFTAPEAGRGAGEGGALPTAGREGRGQAEAWFQFGSLLRIYAAPVHVLVSAGKGKGTARFRLGAAGLRVCIRPSDRSLRWSRETARPARLSGFWAVAGILGGGGGAAVGRELRVRVPGRGRQWKQGEGARAHPRGAAAGGGTGGAGLRGSPAPIKAAAGAGGLTPPPACPGSDARSRRAPRAGRGRGRRRRRRRPPGRRGRRRAAGNP